MTVNQSLLEEMSAHIGLVYLSDLHYLSFGQRKKLAHKLQRMTPREDDMDQWNEALQYLAGLPAEDTARDAWQRLVKWLRDGEPSY